MKTLTPAASGRGFFVSDDRVQGEQSALSKVVYLTETEMEAAMADRVRSKDGRQETKEILGAEGTISQGGRTGGRLAREVATEDEKKRAMERPAGATRVTKSNEQEDQ